MPAMIIVIRILYLCLLTRIYRLQPFWMVKKSVFYRIFLFIEKCKQQNIELHIAISPYYANLENSNPYQEISEQIFSTYGVRVLNFQQDTAFINHPEYFFDPMHLNSQGAKKYTAVIANAIKTHN